MEFANFVQLLRDRLPVRLVMDNPGGGTSTIEHCDDERIRYRRGNSSFTIQHHDLYEAFNRYCGGDVTTTRLKEDRPAVFDSDRNGHNCHCTFFFLAMQRIGFAGEIWGSGVAGSPFGVTLRIDDGLRERGA